MPGNGRGSKPPPGGGPGGIDRAEVARALRVLADPEHNCELRGLPSARSFVRPGSDVEALAGCAAELEDGKGTYFALNPVGYAEDRACKDGDVLRRRWLLVDIDPARPADSNATDDEKAAAKELADAVREFLVGELGWPAPVEVDSGNGYHLLLRVNGPADDPTRGLFRDILRGLARLFDTERAAVDTAVHNASRISKLPGTVARKGPHSADRPHRMARLLRVPEPLEVVSAEQLRQAVELLKAEASGDVPAAVGGGGGYNGANVANGRGPFRGMAGGRRPGPGYVTGARNGEAGNVLSAPEGNRNNALNKAAFKMGTLVGAGLMTEDEAIAALFPAGVAAGLGETETRRTISSGLEAGKLKPRVVPGRPAGANGRVTLAENWAVPAALAGWRFDPIDSAAFAATDDKPDWLVKRLLVRNQPCIGGGPVKTLKTSIFVDLAVSLGTATRFLGIFDVYRKVKVMLLSGESGRYALRETARRVCDARGTRLDAADVLWQFDLPRLPIDQDLQRLRDGLKDRGVEVVIIDPLYLTLLAGGAIDTKNLFEVGPLLLRVASHCLEGGATPVLIHHVTKPAARRMDEPLSLEDLSYGGIAEFARQWLLVNRREPFAPGLPHKLRLAAGGNCGQGGLWSVDVDEGELDEDFGGRKWDVTVAPMCEAKRDEREERRRQKEEEDRRKEEEEDRKFLAALDSEDPCGAGVSLRAVRDAAKMSGDKARSIVSRLRRSGVIESMPEFTTRAGNGAVIKAEGVRRADRDSEGGDGFDTGTERNPDVPSR